MSDEHFIVRLEGDELRINVPPGFEHLAAALARRPREVVAAMREPSGAAMVEELERVLGPGSVVETRLFVARTAGIRRRRGGSKR